MITSLNTNGTPDRQTESVPLFLETKAWIQSALFVLTEDLDMLSWHAAVIAWCFMRGRTEHHDRNLITQNAHRHNMVDCHAMPPCAHTWFIGARCVMNVPASYPRFLTRSSTRSIWMDDHVLVKHTSTS